MGLLDVLASIPRAITEKAQADEFGRDWKERRQRAADVHNQSELENALSNVNLETKVRGEAARMRALMGDQYGDPVEAEAAQIAQDRADELAKRRAGVGLVNAQTEFYAPKTAALEAHSEVEAQRANNDAIKAEAARLAAEAAGVRARRPPSSLFGGAGGVTLNPEAIHKAALIYNTTNTLPGFGMGGAADKKQIMNAAGLLDPNVNPAANAAQYKANAKALGTLQTTRDTVGAYEGMSQQNIGRLLDAAGNVIDTGFQPLNTLLRTAARSGTFGKDPAADQAVYDAARQVAVNEIARIVTSTPNLAGQLSDTARKEVEAFNPAGATLEQSVRVLKLLTAEVHGRTENLDTQLGEIRTRLGGSAQPAAPMRKQFRNPQTGALAWFTKGADGQWQPE